MNNKFSIDKILSCSVLKRVPCDEPDNDQYQLLMQWCVTNDNESKGYTPDDDD